uniref:Uncharacterized protein n=1 Tax=Triticum urartu TaxID=4572 RepID=A0A8R7RG08_TRIUA
PPKLTHHRPRLQPATYQGTSNKGCDVDDTAARTCPRVSPGTRKEVGDGYIRHPPRRDGGNRRCHRIGAGRELARDFSRKTPPPNQAGANQPPRRPPACATTLLTPPP